MPKILYRALLIQLSSGWLAIDQLGQQDAREYKQFPGRRKSLRRRATVVRYWLIHTYRQTDRQTDSR